MIKTILLLAVFVFTFALAGFASAQEGTLQQGSGQAVTTPVDTAVSQVPSIPSTGSASSPQAGSRQIAPGQVGGNVGDEVSRLQREMEEKIRAIRSEYQIKIVEARKAMQAVRQNVRQNAKQNVRQNVRQNVKQNIKQNVRQNVQQQFQQNIKQDVRENVRQNIEGLLQPGAGSSGGQPGSRQGFQGIQGQQQQNQVGPTQEQFGPPPTGGSGSGGGITAPAPFSSSILQKFLPSYSW